MPRVPRSVRWLPVLAALLALSACQQGAPDPAGAIHVSPAASRVAPGGQVQFTATSPWGGDVAWSVSPADAGSIDASGLFTASRNPSDPSGICTVVATLRSDPSRVGMAVVMVELPPPVDMVAASGGRQSAGDVSNETVVQEPFSSTTSRDATGTVESRSGFYPGGTPGAQ